MWRLILFLLSALGLALVLAGAERFHNQTTAALSEPGRGASWIWARGMAEAGEPTAFYAVRDFEIEAPSRAWITVVADETYTLWANGRRIGSGGFRSEAPADFYDVSRDLVTGLNRLTFEVASTRGAGGLLASLRLGTPDRAVLGTDASWRIFRRFDPSVIGGTRALGPTDGEAPAIWQRPHTGRWRPSEALALKPIGPVRQWRSARRFEPVRTRYFLAGSEWHAVSRARPLWRAGGQAVFDLGREVLGHLEATFDTSPGPALLYFDRDEPSGYERPPDAILLTVDGHLEWRDPFARRFRYVTMVATVPCRSMRVTRVSPEEAARHAAPPPIPRGVFGLPSPTLPPNRRVEQLVWQRLQEKSEAGEKSQRPKPEPSSPTASQQDGSTAG